MSLTDARQFFFVFCYSSRGGYFRSASYVKNDSLSRQSLSYARGSLAWRLGQNVAIIFNFNEKAHDMNISPRYPRQKQFNGSPRQHDEINCEVESWFAGSSIPSSMSLRHPSTKIFCRLSWKFRHHTEEINRNLDQNSSTLTTRKDEREPIFFRAKTIRAVCAMIHQSWFFKNQ